MWQLGIQHRRICWEHLKSLSSAKCNWVMVNGCQQSSTSSTLSACFDRNARTFMDIRGTKIDRWNQLKKKPWDLQNTAPCCIEYALNLLNCKTLKANKRWRPSGVPPWKWALWNSAKPRPVVLDVRQRFKWSGRWPMVNDFKDLCIEILLCGKASSVISWGYPPEIFGLQSAKIPCWIPPIRQFQRVENRCNLWNFCSWISKKTVPCNELGIPP